MIARHGPEWGIDDPALDQLREAFLDARRASRSRATPRAIRTTREATKVLLDDVYRTRPIQENKLWHGRATWLDEIFDHEDRGDSNWRRINPTTHYGVLDLPAVHVGGWYDVHLAGVLQNFTGMRRQAPTERARQVAAAGRRSVDPLDPDGAGRRRHRLRARGHLRHRRGCAWPGSATGCRTARARTGRRSASSSWARTSGATSRSGRSLAPQYTPWYLGPGGRLGPEPPADDEPPDVFTYDPRDPAPTFGGRLLGSGEVAGPVAAGPAPRGAPMCCRTDLNRSTAPMELTGPLWVELWSATDAPDTDFTAVLVDEHPDGRAEPLRGCRPGPPYRHTDAVGRPAPSTTSPST